MPAAITDKFTSASSGSRAVPTTLSATKTQAATTISCAALTGWPTGTAVHFSIYTTTTTNGVTAKTPNSQTDWKGVVSGSTITNLTLRAGTDNGYGIGAIVEAAPTAAWADDMVAGVSVQHNQDGTHNTAAATTIAANLPSGSVAPAALATGVPANKLSNPYKFSAYRNAPGTFVNGGRVQFDTKEYDTGNNFDITTNIGRFTAPVAGYYHFDAMLTAQISGNSGVGIGIAIAVNGSTYRQGMNYVNMFNGSYTSAAGISCMVKLNANDYVEVFPLDNLPASTGGAINWFQGFLISTT